jgi:hypothetical protein
LKEEKWKWIGHIPRKGKGTIKRDGVESQRGRNKKYDQEERGEGQFRMEL